MTKYREENEFWDLSSSLQLCNMHGIFDEKGCQANTNLDTKRAFSRVRTI